MRRVSGGLASEGVPSAPTPADASHVSSRAEQRRVAAAWRSGEVRRRAAVKRTVDLVLGTVLFVASLPLQLALCVASAVALRAWPVFVQQRPGREGRPFRIVKIRTLAPSVPAYGHKSDLAAEMRATPAVCAFMRRTHLDELPQLGLVPFGRMSLVGPRPSQPLEYEHIDETFEWMRTAVRPGCTGLWQIGLAHDGSLEAAPEYDTYYLERACLRLDLWICVRTVLFMLRLVDPIDLAGIPRWAVRRTPTLAPRPVPATAVEVTKAWDGAPDAG